MVPEINMPTELFICLMAGFLSFFTPCVFPLVPVFFIGISQNTNRLIGTALFSVGMTIAFLSLALIISSFGNFLSNYMDGVNLMLCIALILFGIFTLIPHNIPIFSSTIKIDLFDCHLGPYIKPFLMGFTFGFGWSPCVGPVLSGILGLAINADTLAKSLLLLSFYSFGICIPLFLFAIIGTSGCFYSKLKQYTPLIEKVGGVCLILFGLYTLGVLYSII